MNSRIETVLNKKVSRKEFLQHAGLALLAVTGAAGILKGLQSLPAGGTKQTAGYGVSSYGGAKKS